MDALHLRHPFEDTNYFITVFSNYDYKNSDDDDGAIDAFFYQLGHSCIFNDGFETNSSQFMNCLFTNIFLVTFYYS